MRSAEAVEAMFPSRYQLSVITLFTALIVSLVRATRCPFALANRSSTGSCQCNRILHEIICSDLDAVPDFSTSADDDYCSLYMQRGTIHSLGPSAFAGLPRLVKIVVDFNRLNVGGLHQAAFQWDTDRAEERMALLRELSIGASRVQSLPPRLLAGLSQLRRLSLWGNEVDRLPVRFFDPVAKSLIELSLWGNRLERIDDATFDVGARQHWSSLRTLDLDRNSISWLGHDAFRSMPNMETLRLAGNRIAALSAEALSGLHRLRSLRLEHNGLGFIHVAAFVGLESLLSLSLGDNALAFLPDGLFERLGRLVDLRLQNNRLEYVWWQTFRGLRSLRRIDLSGNRLSNLPDDVFRHSTRLSVLSLDDNHLRTLRRCSLPPIDGLIPAPTPSPQPLAGGAGWSRMRRRRTLSLLGNVSLRCDCRLAWLAAQVYGGITTVWGSCDVTLDPPPSLSLTETMLAGRCPIVAVVLRQRFDVCPPHTRHQTNCKT